MSNQLSMAQLIELLDRYPEDMPVRFDFTADVQPYHIDSYRGDYSHLSVDYEPCEASKKVVTRQRFSLMCQWSMRTEHEGYKGGQFWTGPHTPVWVSHYGQHDGRRITGVKQRDGIVVIITAAAKSEPAEPDPPDNGADEAALSRTIQACKDSLQKLQDKHYELYEHERMVRAELLRAEANLWNRRQKGE